MPWTIVSTLLIAWALKAVTGYTLDDFVHALLVIAPDPLRDSPPELVATSSARSSHLRLKGTGRA